MFSGLKLKQEILLCESLFYFKSTGNENNSSKIYLALILVQNNEMPIYFANVAWTSLAFMSPSLCFFFSGVTVYLNFHSLGILLLEILDSLSVFHLFFG
jgi:hypothetical protein